MRFWEGDVVFVVGGGERRTEKSKVEVDRGGGGGVEIRFGGNKFKTKKGLQGMNERVSVRR